MWLVILYVAASTASTSYGFLPDDGMIVLLPDRIGKATSIVKSVLLNQFCCCLTTFVVVVTSLFQVYIG